MDQNLCVLCGVDMGDNNPRQLCGKTMCPNEGRWTTLFERAIPDGVEVGWANRLSLAVEAVGFSDAKEKAQVRRLVFNLPKYWGNLGEMTVETLAVMTAADMVPKDEVKPVRAPSGFTSSGQGGHWLEQVHDMGGDWFRNC